jgi:hypothetical protein
MQMLNNCQPLTKFPYQIIRKKNLFLKSYQSVSLKRFFINVNESVTGFEHVFVKSLRL